MYLIEKWRINFDINFERFERQIELNDLWSLSTLLKVYSHLGIFYGSWASIRQYAKQFSANSLLKTLFSFTAQKIKQTPIFRCVFTLCFYVVFPEIFPFKCVCSPRPYNNNEQQCKNHRIFNNKKIVERHRSRNESFQNGEFWWMRQSAPGQGRQIFNLQTELSWTTLLFQQLFAN